MAFKRSRNLKELIGSNCIENGKLNKQKIHTIGKYSPCLSKTGNLLQTININNDIY